MACDPNTTITTEKLNNLNTNIQVIDEVVTSDKDLTNTKASDGEQKLTLEGLKNLLFDTALPNFLPPVTSTQGQTDFFVGTGLSGVQVNRNGTIEQVNSPGQTNGSYSYNSSTGIVTLNEGASIGESFQFAFNLIPGGVPIQHDGGSEIYVDLTEYELDTDTSMHQAWDRMLADKGITSNATSKFITVYLGNKAEWVSLAPCRQYRGIKVDVGGSKIIDRAASTDIPEGEVWYRNKGIFWAYPDTDVPARNTFVTENINEDDGAITVDDISKIEKGDYLVIDLWDGGYDENRDYSGVPIADGWQGMENGLHPVEQKIVRVVDVIAASKRVVVDYRFGWRMRVADWPATRRDGTQYKGTRDTLYIDGLWDGSDNNPYESDIMNNVRIFKPSELPTDIGVKNYNYECQSVSTQTGDPVSGGRWQKWDRYFANYFYTYRTHFVSGNLENCKMGNFIGVYNSVHGCSSVECSYVSEGSTGGEGYLTNGGRGHSHYHSRIRQAGGRHVHDSTGGAYMVIEFAESFYEFANTAGMTLHGRYEHNITYLNCQSATLGLAANGVAFGRASKNVNIEGGKYKDVFGFCHSLKMTNVDCNSIGQTRNAALFYPQDLHDASSGMYVAYAQLTNVKTQNETKIAVDPRYMVALDTVTVPGGHTPAADVYDPYTERGVRNDPIINDLRRGLYISNSTLCGARFVGHHNLDISGGKLWDEFDHAVATIKDCRYHTVETELDRVRINVEGRFDSSTINVDYAGNYIDGTDLFRVVFWTDIENWTYSHSVGCTINLTGGNWIMRGKVNKAFSISRSSPIQTGDLPLVFNMNGLNLLGSVSKSRFTLDNIALTGLIMSNIFSGQSIEAFQGGSSVSLPDGLIIKDNIFTGGADNVDKDDWYIERNVNLSFASTSIPSGGEIRALVPQMANGYTPKAGDSVVVNLNNLPDGCVACAYFDNTTDNMYKVKVINASGATQNLASTLCVLSYLRSNA